MPPWLLIALSALLVAAAVVLVLARRFDARVRADAARVGAVAAPAPAAALPDAVARWIAGIGLPADGAERCYRIEQRGEMRLKPGGRWLPFTARQVSSVGDAAFVWDARFGALRVVDQLVDGRGALEARLLGAVRLTRADGAAVTKAELLRYLAELSWAPRALVGNGGLTFGEGDDGEVTATLTQPPHEVTLQLVFDDAGDLREVRGVRDRMVGAEAVATPWRGRFDAHRELSGVRVPTRAEVEWLLPEGPFVYWRARVVALTTG